MFLSFFFPFCLFGNVVFVFVFVFCTISAFTSYGEYVVRSFLPDDGVFYLVTAGWIFDITLCENSINQSINIPREAGNFAISVFVCNDSLSLKGAVYTVRIFI